MPIQGVIFDLDGVIIDSASAHLESWRRLAGKYRLDVGQRQFSDTFGRRNHDIIPLLWGRAPSQEQVERLSDEKEAVYRDLVRGRIASIAMPGAVSLIRDCHASGLRLAIGSSTPPENVELALSELGLTDCFRVRITSRDVTRGKPAPDVFLAAAEGIGVAPRECAVIEDAPAGIEAAIAAGCAAVGLTSHHSREHLIRAHLVVESLSELSSDRLRSLGPG